MILMNSLSRIDFGKGIFTYEIFCLLLIFGSYGIIKDKLGRYLYKFGNYLSNTFLPKQTKIEIIGWEFLSSGLFSFEYPHNMKAINYYVYSLGKSKNFRYFNNKRNGIFYSDEIKDSLEHDNTPNYILGEVSNVHLEDDIYLNLYIDEITNGDNKPDNNSKASINWKITMTLSSYKKSPLELQDYINRCMLQYDNYTTNKNKNKTYHFIYQGKNNGKLSFITKVISDFNNPDLQNYETFDNVFHSNKDLIIKDIDKLKDIDYYKRTGLKRKKGYLFYGKPGTGKTITVMAMSNYDRRHIIEVPLHRVKTNNEFEQILNISQINGIKFNPDNVIIFFDEIDIGTKLNRDNMMSHNKSDEDNDTIKSAKMMIKAIKSTSEIEHTETVDKLNIGTLLTRLDGIGNYAGIIIVGATNDISGVDKALYRDGRLNLLKFDNASIRDLKNIIERYYQIELTKTQFEVIKRLDMKVSHAKIRLKLEHFDTIDELIDVLKDLDIVNSNSASDSTSISDTTSIFDPTSISDSTLVISPKIKDITISTNSDNESIDKLVDESVDKLVDESVDESVDTNTDFDNESVDELVDKLVDETIDTNTDFDNESVDELVDESVDTNAESDNESVDESVDTNTDSDKTKSVQSDKIDVYDNSGVDIFSESLKQEEFELKQEELNNFFDKYNVMPSKLMANRENRENENSDTEYD